ncbi:unnamed protein product [Closterium sp. Naga37s-1]|nr:unnamed protein product [Closterium sp. Naga37s-1]
MESEPAKRFKSDSRDLFPDSKAKPCTKFFSTSGCPYGEECHFQHYVPGDPVLLAQVWVVQEGEIFCLATDTDRTPDMVVANGKDLVGIKEGVVYPWSRYLLGEAEEVPWDPHLISDLQQVRRSPSTLRSSVL